MKTGKIKDVKIPLMVSLGEKEVSVDKLSQIGEGSIIELNKLAGEPVDVLAGGEYIGKGEVVVIDENFGVRMTEILKPDGEKK
jgi:flagellar motor switch protein FliN/FliY